MKKVIFLDIDGVLNVCYGESDDYGQLFHPHLVENLKTIIDATEAKIVISSTWRHNGLSTMKNMWMDRMLPGQVIDITPDLNRKLKSGLWYSPIRGEEIKAWLSNNEVDAYVIIDDDKDMLEEQLPNFVKTSGNTHHLDHVDGGGYGLTKKCAEQAIRILNKNN
jgi:hypothetical protein